MNQEKEADDFHDSDDEDVYDLFLAVNGETKDGLLDISKLDQLTPDEAEILNAPRLREIWDHTKTGCLKCKEIIRTLNIVRNALRKEADDNIAALNNVKIDQSTSH